MRRPINASILRLIVVLIIACFALSPLFPWAVTPAAAPPGQFSAERALSHLSVIAQAPHPAGSPAQFQLRDYLVEQLTNLGLEVDVQKVFDVENVVARLRGSNSSGAILLQAHYDSYN